MQFCWFLLYFLLLLHIQVTHSHEISVLSYIQVDQWLGEKYSPSLVLFCFFPFLVLITLGTVESKARCVTDKCLLNFSVFFSYFSPVFMLVWLLAGLYYFFSTATTRNLHTHHLLLNNACPGACDSAIPHTTLRYRKQTFQRHRNSMNYYVLFSNT